MVSIREIFLQLFYKVISWVWVQVILDYSWYIFINQPVYVSVLSRLYYG